MASELKVRNQFREVILQIRLTSGDVPELLTITATEEMRSAVSSLTGLDFDRTVGSGTKMRRYRARWGSEEYAQVLAEYFQHNFGWSTSLVETEQPSSVQSTGKEAERNAMAAAVGVGTNGLSYVWSEFVSEARLGSGPAFNPVIASIAGQQSALGEL